MQPEDLAERLRLAHQAIYRALDPELHSALLLMLSNAAETYDLSGYIPELETIIATMTRFGSLEERRGLFHQERHRAFDSEFFPALFVLLSIMSEVDETGPAMVGNLWAAILLELRDLFSGVPPESLSTSAACVDLLVVAELEENGELGSGLAFVRRGLAYARAFGERGVWDPFIDDARVETERLAVAAEAQTFGGPEVRLLCTRWASACRAVPVWLDLVCWLSSATACDDLDALRIMVQRRLEGRPEADNAVACAQMLEQVLRQEGSGRRADKARQIVGVLSEQAQGRGLE